MAIRYSTDASVASSYFKREFRLCYQPIICLETQNLYSFEGLTYWQPDKARLYSSNPLTRAEKSQLDIPFHQWVLDEACRQLQSWQMQYVGDVLSCLSIDLSVKPLFCSYFAEFIEQSLTSIGIAPGYLQLEIPAQWVMQNRSDAKTAINRFKRAGISICIDDLHFSDLSYQDWFSLPIKALKISKIDMYQLSNSLCMEDFLKTTISIASKANIQVIPKGIETDEQLIAMKALGCAYGQGYLLSKPLPSRQATVLISSQLNSQPTELASYLTVMTILNKTAQKFLGETLTARYWNETKPKTPWLVPIEPYKDRKLVLSLAKSKDLDVNQRKDLKHWIYRFIQRCSAIIRNFQQLLIQTDMTPVEAQFFKVLCPNLL
ncbi:MAG: EAL domain-containing protein [Cyanobacteria bacterium P01_A01_bin.123]